MKGLSRQFAFAQFKTLSDAKTFLDNYFPSIQLYGLYDQTQTTDTPSHSVRIAYSREKEDRDRAAKSEDEWICDIVCFSSPALKTHLIAYSAILSIFHTECYAFVATRREPVSSFLCQDISPDLIILEVPQSASTNSVAPPNMSAFSGFATTGDSDVSIDSTPSQFLLLRGLEPGVSEELLAKGVMKLYKPKEDVPVDVQAAKKAKIASTSNDAALGARDGSLQRVLLVRDRSSNDSWRYGFAEFGTVEDAQAAMTKYKASEKFTISSKPVMVSYIHAGVFVPMLYGPARDTSKFTFSPLSNASVKLMYWDEAAYVSELVIAKDERSTLAKAKDSLNAKLAAASAKGVVAKDAELKGKKRKAEKDATPSTKKVVAPHLQFWSNRHAELHGLPSNDADETPKEDKIENETPVQDPPSQSYADLSRRCCLLCSRQFKTEAEVNKHERMSQLHRDNLLNEDLKTKALIKLTKSAAAAIEEDSIAYRDRAKERRQAFNQPKQPTGPQKAQKEKMKPKKEETPLAPSKGAALLGKMGWTAGEGLGAQGTGRTEAITTELYSQGVGLGAEGGKLGDAIEEANRSTKGSYSDFVSKSKEKAKERFERMA